MKTAILIAAHNEEQNLEATLKSCKGYDTFVADDNSTDATYAIAHNFAYAIRVKRGGKGRAIKALIDHYDILSNYDAFVMLDADTILAPGAMAAFEKAIRPAKVAAAVGQLRSANKGLYAAWRTVQYTMVYRLYRRGMETLNTIHVLSGTCSIWKTDVVRKLDWQDSPVEDMDMTYQIHRKKLGRIAYAPKAVVHTQEPISLKDYTKQTLRWFKGYWLTTAKYKAPLGMQSLDFGQAIFIFENAFTWARLIALSFFILLPLWFRVVYLYDVAVVCALVLVTALWQRKPSFLAYLPLLLVMYVYDILLNLYAFIRYRNLKTGVWVSPERSI